MNTQCKTRQPNIVKRVCTAGVVEHAWIPPFRNGDYVSVSAPSSICLAFSRHLGCVVRTTGKTSRRNVEPGCVSIAGREPIYWLDVREPADVVEVTAASSVRCRIADEMGVADAAELDDLHGGTDTVIWAIAVRLRTSLRGPAEADNLEHDELIWHLYRHVFATHFGGRLPVRGDGKLGRRRLQQVIAFVEEHLTDSRLSVAMLADIASMSAFHFLRSFARTLHMTPHSFVRARRLERIRAALRTGIDPMEVARHYRFTHVRHFRTAYRRHHGLAPGDELSDVL